MEKAAKNYPTYQFSVEGFWKIRAFANGINSIEKKIDFYNFLIEKYDDEHSPFEEPTDVDISDLLRSERNFWVSVQTIIKNSKTPEYKEENEDLWKIQFDENSNIKVDFKKRELFDFDLVKIIEHSKRLGTLKNGLIYLKYVLKEFEIHITINPKEYLEQQMGGFKRDILNEIKLIEDEIKGNTIDSQKKLVKPEKVKNLENEIEKLKKEKEQIQKDNEQINRELEITHNKIKVIRKKSIISKYTNDENELKKLIDQTRKRNGKHNYAAIGRILGCNHETAKRHIERMNLQNY